MKTINVYFNIRQNGNLSNTIFGTLQVTDSMKDALMRDVQNNNGAYLAEQIERNCFDKIQSVMMAGVPFTVVGAHISS